MFPRHGKLLVALCSFLTIVLILYWYVDSSNTDLTFVKRVEERVEILQGRILDNERLMEKLKEELNKDQNEFLAENKNGANNLQKVIQPIPLSDNLRNAEIQINRSLKGNKVQQVYYGAQNQVLTNFCPIEDLMHNSTSNVQMLNVYEILPFDNVDGGVWKQGWNIEYDSVKVQSEERLEVFIIPHSHDDPGWLKTFEEYYYDDVSKILNNMVKQLKTKTDMKFVYAEMSFFEMWWSELTQELRNEVKKLIESGRLEIVTGGWVMTDEANSNYFSTIMEMIEGHEFLQNQLGFIPKNHWSIDPFGLSSTIPYLLNRANFSNMAINRVHYSVKKHLAKQKQLEFRWRQLFAKNADTDITAHMFPFFSYDVPHTCGPDPKICCQFDFRRLRAFGCPWGKPPRQIDDVNVAERAALLADQYRKKAQLYRMNTVLIPLGDDFRYDTELEWVDQYSNYRKLMNYINTKKEWNMNVQFGTLENYFSALKLRLLASETKSSDAPAVNLPILTGDFFTYADRDDHYWSGYFTSRPFYKHLDRTLQHYLRSADILFGIAHAQSSISNYLQKYTSIQLYDQLVEARRALALFQHHDGVTGTAREYVVKDYGQKMLDSINKCKTIIASTTQYLMKLSTTREEFIKIDEEHFNDLLPEKAVNEDGSSIVVFNSLAQSQREVTCIHVNSVKSRISSGSGAEENAEILQQIGPVLYVDVQTGRIRAHKDKFELCFVANVPPMGFVRYSLFEADDPSHKVILQTFGGFSSTIFDVKNVNFDDNLILSNKNFKAQFSAHTGLLKSIILQTAEFPLDISFVKYIPRSKRGKPGDSSPGAYLFLPNGTATKLPSDNNEYMVVTGAVRQYIFLKGPQAYGLQQIISLDVNAHSLSINNFIDLSSNVHELSKRGDAEIAMRIKSEYIEELESDEKFFTDLNNFQMIRRRRFQKLPIQAQFYPMSGAAYVENSHRRITLLGRQALGVASLEKGSIEVMLDRSLSTEDDRGLGEALLDNKRTVSQFRLFIEPNSLRRTVTKNNYDEETIGYHTSIVNFAQLTLHYPLMVLTGQLDNHGSDVPIKYSFFDDLDFACDVHVVGLRTLSFPTIYSFGNGVHRKTKPDSSFALILHRFGTDCRYTTSEYFAENPFNSCRKTFGEVDLNGIYSRLNLKSIANASLTLLYKSREPLASLVQKLEPMELRTLTLNF